MGDWAKMEFGRNDLPSRCFLRSSRTPSSVTPIYGNGQGVRYQREKHLCKFKKDETKVFKLMVSFPAEGVFYIVSYATAFYGTSGQAGKRAGLNIKTYKDKTDVLLERMPWKLPDNVLRLLPPAVRDSIAASVCI